MKISHSEVQDYVLCRRRWWYGSYQMLDKVGDSSALARGSCGHEVLAAYYGYLAKLKTVEDQKLHKPEALEKAREAFHKHYSPRLDDDSHMPLEEILFTWYFPHEPFVTYGWRILAVERKFFLDMGDGIEYPFTVDMVAYDRSGVMKLIDHKFVFDFYGDAAKNLNPQLPRYLGALRAKGYPVQGALYNEIRTRPLGKTHKNGDRNTQMEVPLNETRMDTTWTELDYAVREIAKVREELDTNENSQWYALRTANEHTCKNCPFRLLCEAELNDKNAELVRNSYYEKKPDRY